MKKWNFKRLAAYFLVLAMAVSMLIGCGGTSEEPAKEAAVVESVADEAEEATEETEESIDEVDEEYAEETEDSDDALEETSGDAAEIDEDGEYTSKDEVALYIYTYGHLPSNFITKKEAKNLGWDSKAGNLGEVAPGKSIGGDYFGNYEEILPVVKGRKYTECDINSDGGYRGAERIIFSNQGQIYYTGNHYKSFELLYGEE